MIVIYIDIILLVILLCLTVFTCGYCFWRVYSLHRNGQVTVLLQPTKVLFSHKKEGDSSEQLRTVVAYRNPLTGNYCVHKSRAAAGYENRMPPAPLSPCRDSPDSGVSDEYEPLRPAPESLTVSPQSALLLPSEQPTAHSPPALPKRAESTPPAPATVPAANYDNCLTTTWNWNYSEYQI